MAVLEWSSDLETGVFEIDLQHRSLVAIANQLHDAIQASKPTKTVEWMLEELALYTRFHFDTEESYMRRYGLDLAREHRVEHAELLSAIKRFRRKLKAGDERVQNEVLGFLGDWLERHIREADRDLAIDVRVAMGLQLQPSERRKAGKASAVATGEPTATPAEQAASPTKTPRSRKKSLA